MICMYLVLVFDLPCWDLHVIFFSFVLLCMIVKIDLGVLANFCVCVIENICVSMQKSSPSICVSIYLVGISKFDLGVLANFYSFI